MDVVVCGAGGEANGDLVLLLSSSPLVSGWFLIKVRRETTCEGRMSAIGKGKDAIGSG